MTRAIAILASVGCIVLMAGYSAVESQPDAVAVSPAALPLIVTPAPVAVAAPSLTGISPCTDPMAIIKAFYDSNDASQYDASIALLTSDATLTSWAEGVNGRHWQERRLSGKEQIRTVLSNRGLRRISGQRNAPIFHEAEAKISGDQVTFMLRPDRLGRDGRPYNPYRVEAVFVGCKIKSLTVIEFISWE